ncbi:hypothetical protein pdam_00018191 [Pocillopora damicornis]|uniref:Uncharacterized protein n=1 Tax=Pocillopora damicornis TaxID=46731 RepID=A0A3M6TU53_POCDA|nr:hypothetical protein pdam_00018191 [Pocillopora damicornis]
MEPYVQEIRTWMLSDKFKINDSKTEFFMIGNEWSTAEQKEHTENGLEKHSERHEGQILSGISSTQARENIFVSLAKVSVAESVNKGVDAAREKCQQRENTIYRTIYVDVSGKCKEEKDSTWSIAND